MKKEFTAAEEKYLKLIGEEKCIEAYQQHIDGSGGFTVGEKFMREHVTASMYTKAGDCIINVGRKIKRRQYKYIQIWGEMMQSFQPYIDREIDKAIDLNAPFNTIYFRKEPVLFSEVTNPEVIEYFKARGL